MKDRKNLKMKNTNNLNLKKPDQTDYYDVDDFNDNADIIDNAVGDMKTLVTEDKDTLVKAINDAYNHGGKSKAEEISIEDEGKYYESDNVEGALQETAKSIEDLKLSVSDGKIKIASAITDKGVPTNGSDTFTKMHDNIELIETMPPIKPPDVGVCRDNNGVNYGISKIDSYTLKKKWTSQDFNANVFSIAVDKTFYVCGCGDHNPIFKLAPDGNIVWTNASHGDMEAITVDSDRNIYSAGDNIFKLDPDGKDISTYTHINNVTSSIVVDDDFNIYIGSWDYKVRKIDKNNRLIWINSDGTREIASIAVDNDHYVYSGCVDNKVRKMDSDGELIWDNDNAKNGIEAVAVDDKYNVYSGGYDHKVYKIDEDNNLIWINSDNEDTIRSIIIDNEYNVYTSNLSYIHKLDSNGKLIWVSEGVSSSIETMVMDTQLDIYTHNASHQVIKYLQYDPPQQIATLHPYKK